MSHETHAQAGAHPTAEPAASQPEPVHVTGLQGVKRRVLFVTLYEVIAVGISSVFFMLMGQNAGDSSSMAVIATTVALLWNVTFNWIFEQWERRQPTTGRSLGRRMAHAVGFEGGLALILVPIIAYWLNVSLWMALKMELGLLVFFFVYTFVFNWLFDRVFGLPASAQLAGQRAAA